MKNQGLAGKKSVKFKKRLFTVLSTIMIVSVMSGCGSNNETKNAAGTAGSEGNAKSEATAGTETEKPLDLTLMLPIFKTNYPKDDSPVAAKLEELTNTNIHFEWVPNASYTDKFNITLASGKLPDIIYVGDVKASSFVNAARSGAFWEVGPYLKDYPNLSQANPVILNNSAIDGKNYGIYRGRALGRNGVVFRKDWLEKLGLETPQTVDEFYNMLKAFKEQDPDGNGKDDTYGMVMVKWTGGWASGFDAMKLWFGSRINGASRMASLYLSMNIRSMWKRLNL